MEGIKESNKDTWSWSKGGLSSVRSPSASLSPSSAPSSTQTTSSPTCCPSARRCSGAGSPRTVVPSRSQQKPFEKMVGFAFFTFADNGSGLPSGITILQILFHFSQLYPLTDGVSVRMRQITSSERIQQLCPWIQDYARVMPRKPGLCQGYAKETKIMAGNHVICLESERIWPGEIMPVAGIFGRPIKRAMVTRYQVLACWCCLAFQGLEDGHVLREFFEREIICICQEWGLLCRPHLCDSHLEGR